MSYIALGTLLPQDRLSVQQVGSLPPRQRAGSDSSGTSSPAGPTHESRSRDTRIRTSAPASSRWKAIYRGFSDGTCDISALKLEKQMVLNTENTSNGALTSSSSQVKKAVTSGKPTLQFAVSLWKHDPTGSGRLQGSIQSWASSDAIRMRGFNWAPTVTLSRPLPRDGERFLTTPNHP